MLFPYQKFCLTHALKFFFPSINQIINTRPIIIKETIILMSFKKILEVKVDVKKSWIISDFCNIFFKSINTVEFFPRHKFCYKYAWEIFPRDTDLPYFMHPKKNTTS